MKLPPKGFIKLFWKIHMYLQEQFNFHCPKELRVQVVPRTNAVWNNMAAR